ncbi:MULTISPECIES: N-acyl-D-amino-acid deacylase family protein [Streptomyces]|uniref:N-acyl-D-aspartate/D-glutamate deacylase n=2 Tax=Streptomyces TaxID=1883 RepID=A0ABT9KSF2_9ACTN|nr:MULTISPECIES: amidohydrolase family protein [Streptomyces]MBW8086520.1 amidohydrolase family protein [Streptomyces hygroscopicus subsp. hygroscopicus]MCO8306007.1 amidohydrolase family protein [Streptomyces sp. RKCA744]MDN3057173.1 amidohydrolase family protein [Streptomyces sp. SRF1]MDP9611335.1 N-acyl-D-aspartate/D-glutamate deacylase [Streptomyces demainii]GHJ29770.1 amidohydrolase [Streptomyces hygroscopicus]
MHDLIIRNGSLCDGSGIPVRTGDVAVDHGVITRVGRVPGRGRTEIDAGGHLVTPGFVDIHTHFDGQVSWDPQLTPSCWHGVTSVVMGNCGVGFAPAQPDRHDWLIGLMEGVEDIPGASLSEGITWEWETFPEYLDAVERLPRVMDVAAQVPHGALRAYVMGDRGAANEPPTEEDLRRMCALVRQGLQAGAIGFSTSRTVTHLAITGDPVPGTFAAEDELFALGGVLGEVGTGVFQLVPLGAGGEKVDDPLGEIKWMRRLSAAVGRPITFGLFQNDNDPDGWRELLQVAEDAVASGADLHPQVAGRPFSIIISLDSTHPFRRRPSYKRIAHLPAAERRAAMRDPALREKILGEAPDDADPRSSLFPQGYERHFPMKANQPDYEPGADESFDAIARRTGQNPETLIYDFLTSEDTSGMIFRPLLGYSEYTLDPIREMLLHPQAVLGLSDAGAHCRLICDASTPTSMLTHWVRDRSRGARLPLEFVVKKQTWEPAQLYGLRDRGLLRPGYRADINIIDLDRLSLRSPEFVHDLPAGGGRLIQKADGYVATVVAGEITFREGEATGALPGRLVRGTRSGPVVL